MDSFYGGLRGKDLHITKTFNNFLEAINDIKNNKNSNVPIGEYILISYGASDEVSHLQNRDIDNNTFGRNFNSSIYRKIFVYRDDDYSLDSQTLLTKIINYDDQTTTLSTLYFHYGVGYKYITGLRGAIPQLLGPTDSYNLISEYTLPETEITGIINSEDPDYPIISFTVPSSARTDKKVIYKNPNSQIEVGLEKNWEDETILTDKNKEYFVFTLPKNPAITTNTTYQNPEENPLFSLERNWISLVDNQPVYDDTIDPVETLHFILPKATKIGLNTQLNLAETMPELNLFKPWKPASASNKRIINDTKIYDNDTSMLEIKLPKTPAANSTVNYVAPDNNPSLSLLKNWIITDNAGNITYDNSIDPIETFAFTLPRTALLESNVDIQLKSPDFIYSADIIQKKWNSDNPTQVLQLNVPRERDIDIVINQNLAPKNTTIQKNISKNWINADGTVNDQETNPLQTFTFNLPRQANFYTGLLFSNTEDEATPPTTIYHTSSDTDIIFNSSLHNELNNIDNGDYYINEKDGYIYQCFLSEDNIKHFKYISKLLFAPSNVYTHEINPYVSQEGTQDLIRNHASVVSTQNANHEWLLDFNLPKIPNIEASAQLVDSVSNTSIITSKTEDTLEFLFNIPRGSRIFFGDVINNLNLTDNISDAKVGDYYLNTSNNGLYKGKIFVCSEINLTTEETTWEELINLIGPKGNPLQIIPLEVSNDIDLEDKNAVKSFLSSNGYPENNLFTNQMFSLIQGGNLFLYFVNEDKTLSYYQFNTETLAMSWGVISNLQIEQVCWNKQARATWNSETQTFE